MSAVASRRHADASISTHSPCTRLKWEPTRTGASHSARAPATSARWQGAYATSLPAPRGPRSSEPVEGVRDGIIGPG